MVTLHLGQKTSTVHRSVHQLVLEAFGGPRPEGLQVRHKDGDRRNNALENLAWGTGKENAVDRVRHRTDPQGERNPFAKLTEEQVRQIRARALAGEVSHRIAMDFPCTARNVRAIKVGRSWPHLWGQHA
jgi:hypothetical protein